MKIKDQRKHIRQIIEDQPIIIHRYVLLSDDGVSAGPSWSWAGSWKGRKDTMGREVWYTEDGPVTARASKRTYNVVCPYSSSWPRTPQMGDKIELVGMDGTSEGLYLINFATEYKLKGQLWKVDLTVEEIQP